MYFRCIMQLLELQYTFGRSVVAIAKMCEGQLRGTINYT